MSLRVQETGKYGRGVFAEKEIKMNELIEASPVIVIDKKECKYLKKTALSNYFFIWGEEFDQAAIVLGYGSLYNHSYEPNANFQLNHNTLTVDFVAIKNIEKDEEITINYNGEPNDYTKLWFDSLE